MKKKTLYAVLVAGGTIGLLASFFQMLEKIVLLKNAHAALACNLNSTFSCTNVLNAWQSSVFHFPNSLMCMVFFTFMLSMGLVGLTGGELVRKLRLWMQGIALFFLAFGTWFLEQSIYKIHAICIFCLFCYTGLLLANFAWLRLNVTDLPISKSSRAWLQKRIASGADVMFWFAIAAVMAFAMLLKFH